MNGQQIGSIFAAICAMAVVFIIAFGAMPEIQEERSEVSLVELLTSLKEKEGTTDLQRERAHSNLEGKRMVLTGHIVDVEKQSIGNHIYVPLKAFPELVAPERIGRDHAEWNEYLRLRKEQDLGFAMLYFHPDFEPVLIEMSKEQRITADCRFKRLVNGHAPLLEDCHLVTE